MNGWLFAALETGGILRLNLYSKQVNIFATHLKMGHFEIDFEKRLIYALNAMDKQLYEISYDGVYIAKWQAINDTQQLLKGQWKSFSTAGTQLMASNGSHILWHNLMTAESDVSVIKDLEWCWKIWPAWPLRLLQPQPRPLDMPENIQIILGSNMAKISWSPPSLKPYQSQQVCQYQKLWEYELEIMDVSSSNAFNIRNIKSTHFQIEKLQANNLYNIKVRATLAYDKALVGEAAVVSNGQWSKDIKARSWPLGQHRFLMAASLREGKRGLLYISNELGDNLQNVGLPLAKDEIVNFVQLNGSVIYETSKNHLKCSNLMNPEMSCNFDLIENAFNLRYDWRGARLYWKDLKRNCIVRSNLGGKQQELLPIFNVKLMELDSYNGYIIYATDSFLNRKTMSHFNMKSQDLQYYQCNEALGENIIALALDVKQAFVYWMVQSMSAEDTQIFRSSLHGVNVESLNDLQVNAKVKFNSLKYLAEIDALLWLHSQESKLHLQHLQDGHKAIINFPNFENMWQAQLKQSYVLYADETVIPEQVDIKSIQIDEGYWDDFGIKWSAVAAADNYTVIYHLLLEYQEQQAYKFLSFEQSETLIRITEIPQTSSALKLTLTACTYWRCGAPTITELKAPAGAPTQPKHLRVFVHRIPQPLEVKPNISALIRWDAPENISQYSNVGYKIYCWQQEELKLELEYNANGENELEAIIGNMEIGQSYAFQVQAVVGTRSLAAAGEKTNFHLLHINPELQSVPRLLYATSDYIAEIDLDFKKRNVMVHTSSEVEHLVVLTAEKRWLWVNDNVELMSYERGSFPQKLARMRAEVLSLTVNWISRIVYWAEKQAQGIAIFELNLCHFEGRIMQANKLYTLPKHKLLKDLLVLPYSQTLLWLQHEVHNNNCTLMALNLSDGQMLKLKNSHTTSLQSMFEDSFNAEEETVNLIDHRNRLCIYELQRQACNGPRINMNIFGNNAKQEMDRDAGYIYILRNETIKAYNRRKHNLEYSLQLNGIKKIKAFNYQQYPPRYCLLPEDKQHLENTLEPFINALGESYIELFLPKVNNHPDCHLPLPGLKYTLHIKETNRTLISYDRFINITDLQTYHNYSLQIQIQSYYQQKLALPALQTQEFQLTTAIGTPSKPRNFEAFALSPHQIQVNWQAPLQQNCGRIQYQIKWQLKNAALAAHKMLYDTQCTLQNLQPAEEYLLQLKAMCNEEKFNLTHPISVSTFELPQPLSLKELTPYHLILSWKSSPKVSATILEYKSLNNDNKAYTMNVTHSLDHMLVPHLQPKTKYQFNLKLYYEQLTQPFIWPEAYNERFVYETLGDRPSAPGQPNIEHITGEIFKVFWEPAQSNNAGSIVEYSLEALQQCTQKRFKRTAAQMQNKNILNQLLWVEEPQPLEDKWLVYCNTTELSCIVRDLHTMRLLMFRVRARNEPYGWGPYSEQSARVSEPYVSPEKRNSLIFAIIAPAVIVSLCIILLVVGRKGTNNHLLKSMLY